MRPAVSITHIDTACLLIEINGYRILTDPTLDHAGGWYYHGYGAISQKTDSPAVDTSNLHPIDLVLLSHHQHLDNFDRTGQRLTKEVGKTISTRAAAKALANTAGLAPWESTLILDQRLKWLKITATPAQHRPSWIPEFVSGSVIGFVIEYYGQEGGVIYISGDTVYFKGVEEVGERFTLSIGLYHVGKVQFRYLTGGGKYTMDGNDLLRAVRATRPRIAIPIHYRGWSHFKEQEGTLVAALQQYKSETSTIQFLHPGVRTEF